MHFRGLGLEVQDYKCPIFVEELEEQRRPGREADVFWEVAVLRRPYEKSPTSV